METDNTVKSGLYYMTNDKDEINGTYIKFGGGIGMASMICEDRPLVELRLFQLPFEHKLGVPFSEEENKKYEEQINNVKDIDNMVIMRFDCEQSIDNIIERLKQLKIDLHNKITETNNEV